jgi:DNA-binding transcriptional LysR family regulator
MDQLRSLRVFVQVVSDGSFAAAARTLSLAPSVVTRAVTDLEDYLGVRLLQRTTRNLALTDVGGEYLEGAKRALTELADADALAGSLNKAPTGNLRILCPPAFATHQLIRHLPEFHRRYPGVHIELSAPGPVAAADENFDVSILSIGQQALQGEFVIRQLAASKLVICAAPAYLLRRSVPQQPSDLLAHDGLLPAVAAVRRELTLFPENAEVTAPQITDLRLHPPLLYSSQLEVLYSAALAGMGVAGLPTFMVADALRDGRLERILPAWNGGTLQLYAAMPTRKHMPIRTRALVDFLVEIFGGTESDPWLPNTA